MCAAGPTYIKDRMKEISPKTYHALLAQLPKDGKGRYKTVDVLRLLKQEHYRAHLLSVEIQHLKALLGANKKL